MVKYRHHRGSLVDSMATVVEVADMRALLMILRSTDIFGAGSIRYPSRDNVTVVKYGDGIDERIGWDTHLVSVYGSACGFTDGMVPE
jgi:hypothetical protein